MIINDRLKRTIVAFAAALVMSSVTVSAAVAPAQANAHSFILKAPVYA